MDSFVILLVVGIGCVVALIVALAFWSKKKRTAAWQAVADELGISYLGDNDYIMAQCDGMRIFSRGTSRRFGNAICGDAGETKITLGDYRYTTGSGKNSNTHVQTVCVLQSNRLNAPHCFLRPEVFLFDTIGQKLGGQDIDFEDDDSFSKAFVLQGDSEMAVRNLFNAEVRQWFVTNAGRSFYFEARGNAMVFHQGKRRSPREAKLIMQQALEIMNCMTNSPQDAV